MTPEQLVATGTQIILGNTYHLMQRPGSEVVERLGGLQEFSGWRRPMLTDSGGYQVFSLADIRSIDDTGVTFQSHIDGSTLRLDPRKAIEVQNQLGADIIMCLDDCPPLPSPIERIEAAVQRTLRWAGECREVHQLPIQWLFGIVQGGLGHDKRAHCARELVSMGFDGYAIGGLSVGESHAELVETLAATTPHLPLAQPRYLMGVGQPRDIVAAVRLGVDMYDCVLPTRNGRNSHVFTATGPLKMRNLAHASDSRPIEDRCDCYCCRNFSRAYLRHLFVTGEMLGPILATLHNVHFYQRLMSRIRELIVLGNLETITAEYPIARDGASLTE